MNSANLAVPSAVRPCKHLMLVGLPGSGKKTLQQWICGVLEDRGVPWGPLNAKTFHKEKEREQIATGELITDPRYWSGYVNRLGEFLTILNQTYPMAHTVLNALATKCSLRSKFVSLGRGEGGQSNFYVVWLQASRETLVDRLTREQIETPETASFSPEWLDRFYETVEFPEAIEEVGPGKRLLLTTEENVFLLNADDEAVGRKGNYLCGDNGIPGMKDFRVRIKPGDNF